MRRPTNRKLACLATLAATVALATTAQSASADTSWHFGPLTETWINDCFDGFAVNGVGEYAGALYDSAAPPKPGDVFYVNVVLNGIDSSCEEITMPDIALPAGVAPAISAANPIRCYTVDNSTATETPDTADCPSGLGAPLNGGTGSIRDPNGPPPGTWDTRAPKAWEFKIPVRASSGGTKTISFPTNVISGSITQSLDPAVDVPVAQGPPPPPPPPPPAHKLTLGSSAKSAKLSGKGLLSFAIRSSENGTARVSGTISLPKAAKVLKLAKRSVKLTAGKATKVTLKLSKKNAAAVRKALKRGKRLTAHVVVSARGASGAKGTKKLSLKLKR